MSAQRVLSGEQHAAVNLGNPDSHSEIPFDRLPWKDLATLCRAMSPAHGQAWASGGGGLSSVNPLSVSLTALNLRNNNLGPRGAQLLLESLVASRSLTSLRLASNELLDDGAKNPTYTFFFVVHLYLKIYKY